VVVHHDKTLDRTTSGSGPIAARTADELARVDAGYWFTRAGEYPFRGRGIGVPTLREVLARYPETGLIIELKQSGSALAERVVRDVRDARAEARVCLGSFSLSALRAARSLAPAIATSAARVEVRMALYRSRVWLSPGRVAYRAFQVPEVSGTTRVVSPRFVRSAHKRGLAVQVWPVDEPDDMRRLLSWGVDGIITDRPDLAVAVVREWTGNLRRRV
jgi:glycerophosphoryl diester phosphodiesterase